MTSDSWRPSASFEALKYRAKIIAQIRHFFANRNVLEVETPLLSSATVTDPHIISIPAYLNFSCHTQTLYLQTSPEFAMKRLLAAGSGSIFQICKAFRHGDVSDKHNPEFTLLEWYRVGFDHHALMDEMDDLLQYVLQTQKADRVSCKEAYEEYAGINPHAASNEELQNCAHQKIDFVGMLSDRNAWLDLLFTHLVEPHLGRERPLFLYDFPESQSALARLRPETPPIASRFEVYFKGIELANGFHELQDAGEQRERFKRDLEFRQQQGLPLVPMDEYLLAALNHGLPDCAGVALGMDRLIMLGFGAKKIKNVIGMV